MLTILVCFMCLNFKNNNLNHQNKKKLLLLIVKPRNAYFVCKYLPDFQPARMRRFPGSRLCWVRTVVSSPCPVHTGSTPDSLRGQAGTAVPELRHRASGKTHNPDIPKTIGLEIRNESLLSVGTCAESTLYVRMFRAPLPNDCR